MNCPRYIAPLLLVITCLSAHTLAEPRHVILIIGDGMDEQQITIARNYLHGAGGELVLDTMPVRGAAQVLTIEDRAGGRPLYVADSANTATSMATGAVTSRGRLSTTAGGDEDITTIMELARAGGYRTGIVATSSVTDATPAAFATHISFRLCENPTQMRRVQYRGIELGSCANDMQANGGPGSIAEQLAVSGVDLILGGGMKHFEPAAEDGTRSVLELARQSGFQVVTTVKALGSARPGRPLLGLFAPGTLPVRLQGEGGRMAEQPGRSLLNHLHRYLGDVSMPAPMTCGPNPSFAGTPTLKQMTETALAHLAADNPRGFFLVIESASIDKQAHERKPCGSIGEVEQLDEALASALVFAETNPHTLVLVTADHSQAAQLIPYHSLFAAYPIPTYTPGYLAIIETPEGGLMSVNYATTNCNWWEHTGAAVPVYANDRGHGIVPPYLRQPELFTVMRDYLRL